MEQQAIVELQHISELTARERWLEVLQRLKERS